MTNNYLNAYNNMCGQFIDMKNTTEQDGDVYVIQNSFEVNHNTKVYNGYIECIFQYSKKGINVGSANYKCDCTFSFSRVTQDKISAILNKPDYSYDIVYDVINEFLKIGQEFKIYKKVKTIQNFKIANFFELSVKKPVNLANITPDTIFDNEYSSTEQILATVNFKMLNKNSDEIHPVIELIFPYASRTSTKVIIDLHPSRRTEQIKQLEIEKNHFKDVLEGRLGTIIQKYVHITEFDLTKLSLQEKLNYIPVIEMNKI